MLTKVGNCRVIDEIGSGGMAVIYKAVQESLNRVVAIKALKTSVLRESSFAIRFEREALSLAQLQHENIVHVYDYFKESDHLFIVMEFVEGIDLYDLLDKVGHLPADVAAIVAMQVARALDYAHYRGVLHRDVKPANIMISRSGGVKLMDFGIARDQSFGDLTETGTGLGTPSYMSPEQILGEKLDHRSDMFSLGVVLYQMCTGKKPFVEDETKSVMHKIRLEKYTRPRKIKPQIPRELERIMARCMMKQPATRYRSTQELVLALERFLARRVDMNYHARLVLYMRNAGVISDEDAEKYLHPAVISGGKAGSSTGDDARILRMAQVQAAILGAMALMVSLIHLAPVGGAVPPRAAPMMAPQLLVPRPKGLMRVVARPWAHVYVDGHLVETTPVAAPIELDSGPHTLVFRNPFFQDVERKVELPPGRQPLVVEADLEKRRDSALPDLDPAPPTLDWSGREAPTGEPDGKGPDGGVEEAEMTGPVIVPPGVASAVVTGVADKKPAAKKAVSKPAIRKPLPKPPVIKKPVVKPKGGKTR